MPPETRMAMQKYIFILALALLLVSCGGKPDNGGETTKKDDKKNIVIPQFSGDSAFQFVKSQTDFGPRVPQTEAHDLCAQWLVERLSEYADTVYVQDFRTRIYNGKSMDGQNIIASFHPEASKRIVLCSHWDSRPFADHDPDEANWNTPIDGANDGASGVGVLMECARLFKQQPIGEKLGIDIIFFDLEDYGPRQDEAMKYYDEDVNHWALGSQYWAKHPHIYGYSAYYGILLDMVGGSNPNFAKEYYSQGYASAVHNKVWRKAFDLGYRSFFTTELGDPISDDHIPLNEAGLPTIDIIDLQPDSSNGSFPEVWHTLDDNIDNIDPAILQIVGNLIINVVYEE